MKRADRIALRREITKIAATAKASPGARGPAGAQGPAGSGAGTLDTIDPPVASVDFADQQALSFRIENRTSDPGTPTTGQIWLRTDL